MDGYSEHERYLRNALFGLNDSSNPKQKEKKLSSHYFEDLKEKLLMQYVDKSLKDVMDCNICKTSFGDALKITTKEKIDFNIKDNDFKNQINNVLAFPGIFRGALDCRAKEINEEMKIAASYAIANLVSDDMLCSEYIIPSPLDKRVSASVAKAVISAAKESGVARI